MLEFIRHLFLPHYSNNQRPKLLHASSIFVLSVLLLSLSVALSVFRTSEKSVLGISFNISSQDLLALTNQERQSAGLSTLTLNNQLTQAAAGKAEDMMTNNYWAHISPTGITPWQFITNAGYHYTSAGENLARGFTTSADVANAWMASPEHRANVLSKSYQEVGFAVREGSLTGESDTVLVVEMFGSHAYSLPIQQVPPVVQKVQAKVEPLNAPVSITPIPMLTITPTPMYQQTIGQTQVVKQPLIDSVLLVRLVGTALVLMFIIILGIDLVLVGRRRIVRIVGHNIDHIIFLIAILLIATILGSGIIL